MKFNKIIKGFLFSSMALGALIMAGPNQANASHYHAKTNVLSNRIKVRTNKHKSVNKGLSSTISNKRGRHKYVSQRVGNKYASEAKSHLYHNINKIHHIKSDAKLNHMAQYNSKQTKLSHHVSSRYVYDEQYTDALGKGYWNDNHKHFNNHNGYDIANDIMNNQIKAERDTRNAILGKRAKRIGIGATYNHRKRTFCVDILVSSKSNGKAKFHSNKNYKSSEYYKLGRKDGFAYGKEGVNNFSNKSRAHIFSQTANARPLRILKNSAYQKGFRSNIMNGIMSVDDEDVSEDHSPDCPWVIPRAVAYRTHNHMFQKGMLDDTLDNKNKSLMNNKQYQAGAKWTNNWISKHVTHNGDNDNQYYDPTL